MEFSGQSISVEAYDVLWESTVTNHPKPAVLSGPSPGATVEQRTGIVRAAWAELRHCGYAGPRGVSDPVRDLLGAVAQPQLAVDIRLFEHVSAGGGRTELAKLGARVAVRGRLGAVAALGPDWFRTWTFPATSLIHEVVSVFAHHEAPARFPGISLFPDELGIRPARRGGTEAVLRLLEGPFLRRAHLCAIRRNEMVGTDQVSDCLTLNDNTAGRFLVFMARNQLTVAPGHRGTFERKLRELTSFSRPY